MSLQAINNSELDFNDKPDIAWVRVQDAVKLLWNENPKLHDIGSLVQSFEKYGFQELPKFDSNLPNVSGSIGAIKAGNGRIETLAQMEKQGLELPRGIAQDKQSGAWVMPLLVGVDAESQDVARAYAIDSNSLTMAGGDFSLYDYFKMYDKDKLKKLLYVLAENSVSTIAIDSDAIDVVLLNDVVNQGEQGDLEREYKDIVIRVYSLECYDDILDKLKSIVDKKWDVDIKAYE